MAFFSGNDEQCNRTNWSATHASDCEYGKSQGKDGRVSKLDRGLSCDFTWQLHGGLCSSWRGWGLAERVEVPVSTTNQIHTIANGYRQSGFASKNRKVC